MINWFKPVHYSVRIRNLRLRWLALVASAFVLIGSTACSSDSTASSKSSTTEKKAAEGTPAKSDTDTDVESDSASIENAITITAPGMSYEVSGDLRPGVGAITLKNTDDESHMMAVARLKDGVTLDQVKEASQAPDEDAMNALVADPLDTAYGTPAPVGPGQSSTVIAPDLKEGTYAIICFFSSDDGTPHFAMGMINEFKVTGSPATEKPESDGTITVDDKVITVPDGFNGKGTFAVENTGTKAHNIEFVRLEDGATLDSYFQGVGEAMATNKSVDNAKGGTMMGGVDVVTPGQSVWVVLDLPAGHYGYLSTEDAQDSPTPPTQIGEFTVS